MITEAELLINLAAKLVYLRTTEGFSVQPRPSPPLRLASYISPGPDFDAAVGVAEQSLVAPYPDTILWLLQPADAPPSRSARVYKRHGMIHHKRKEASGQLREEAVELYVASSGGYAWEIDLEREMPGYFLTGRAGRHKLWRITAVEKDPFGYDIVSFLPVTLLGGFPQLDLPPGIDPLWQTEIHKQYEALQQAVQDNRFRAVVTESKNLAESLMPIKQGSGPSRNFAKTLSDIRQEVEQAKKTHAKPVISEMTYHLAEKLRLLHQLTHTGGTMRKGRPLTPEFALTAAQDAIEILRDLEFTRG